MTVRDLATLKKHAALFDDMGHAAGLDLQQQAVDGRLALDEISEAVLRCSKCAHPGQCAKWMASQGPAPATPPDYCRNRDLLDYLHEEVC